MFEQPRTLQWYDREAEKLAVEIEARQLDLACLLSEREELLQRRLGQVRKARAS